jgi:hypothetical protein
MNTGDHRMGVWRTPAAEQRAVRASRLNVHRQSADACGVGQNAPQMSAPPGVEPTRGVSEVLERLRASLGPSSDDLIESVRRQLQREYERGYCDGRAPAARPPAPRSTGYRAFKRRLHRRLRHAARDWLASTAQLRRTKFNLLLVVVLTAAGVALSMRVASSGAEGKFAIPALGR